MTEAALGRLNTGLVMEGRVLQVPNWPKAAELCPVVLSLFPPPQLVSKVTRVRVTHLVFLFPPESRCDKDMDTLSGYAMCLPNLTRLQTYRFVEHRPILCIEIKVPMEEKVLGGGACLHLGTD